MRSLLFAPFALCLAGLASAQALASDQLRSEEIRLARPGDEGPLRFGETETNWDEARAWQPRPLPDTSLPAGFVNEVAIYDVATGTETYLPIAPETGLTSSWITGNALIAEIPEWEDSFGTPTLTSSTSFPWAAQCRVFATQSGGSFFCSGTLVDAKTVITAGHCVHEGPSGTWSTGVSVVPAWDGTDDAYGSSFASTYLTFSNWASGGSLDWDMGFIRLSRPVGFLTGWLGYGFDNDDTFYTTNFMNFAAYPDCSGGCVCSFAGCPDALYYSFGMYDSVTPHRLTAALDSPCFTGGMDGGGVYAIVGGTRFVHGVDSTRTTTGCKVNSTTATRMEQTKNGELTNYITGNYSSTFDLIPMDVNTDATVAAGGRLTTLDYLLANNSTADPALTVYNLDVYLSTNNNISTGDTLLQNRTVSHDFEPMGTLRATATPSLPQIPVDTVPGTYWIGVILNLADGDPGNNDTDGWDAAEVTVLPKFPNLPSTSLFVPAADGVHIDFEGTLPAYAAKNAFDADTQAPSPTAWVNYNGDVGPQLDPFQGNGYLELGNDPLGSSVFPENVAALVLRLDGEDGANFVLDFMLSDHGEEFQGSDGVSISQDGNIWYSLTPSGWGPLSPLGTGEWYSVRDVQLTGATPVNTDADFYLAFSVQDNFPFAGADGVGIDDIRIHRADDLTLTVSNLVSGATSQLHHSGGTPGRFGCISYSVTGGGPITTALGVFYITPPWRQIPCALLDANGQVTQMQPLPTGLTGTPVWFQTLELPGLELSNGVGLVIK